MAPEYTITREGEPSGALVLRADGRPVGRLDFRASGEAIDVDYVVVDDALRGLGMGRRLVNAAVAWAREVERRGAGEIVLTSMDADGTKAGYDLPILRAVCRAVTIPVVASGGAGNPEHLRQAFEVGADAALAASIFHYNEYSIPETKAYLASHGIAVRQVLGVGEGPLLGQRLLVLPDHHLQAVLHRQPIAVFDRVSHRTARRDPVRMPPDLYRRRAPSEVSTGQGGRLPVSTAFQHRRNHRLLKPAARLNFRHLGPSGSNEGAH